MNTNKEIKNSSDIELVQKFRKTQDNTVVGVLFERYTHLVFGVCMKYLKNKDEAQDAVMHIFEKLIVDLKKHTVENFKAWLYMVAKNHCLMQLRSGQSQLKKDKELKKDYPIVMETNYSLHLDNENNKEKELTDLEKCIEKLNEKQKLSVELFFLQEKCYQEVAEITGCSMNDVKSFIQNGKRNLKICMEESGTRKSIN